MQIIENAVYMGAATPGTGGAAVIDTLNVTPTTSAQTITAPEGTDGYSPVNVAAVTSSIDANIVAGNIKKDVEILGVTGSYEGQTPTGTMYIISNGTYNVADKAIANVNVPTTAPAHYVEKTVDANGKLINGGASVINFNGVTDIGEYALYYAYKSASLPANTSVDMSSVTKATGNYACSYMFYDCASLNSIDLSSLSITSGGAIQQFAYAFAYTTNLESADLSSLTEVGRSAQATEANFKFAFSHSGIKNINLNSLRRIIAREVFANAFEYCNRLTSINLSNLIFVERYGFRNAFQYCTGLTSADLSSLVYLQGESACEKLFFGCTSLTSVDFTSLSQLNSNYALQFAFSSDSSMNMQSISFPALRSRYSYNVMNNLVYSNNGCTLHFPKNLDPQNGSTVVSGLQSYPSFGGTNTVVLFDLPSTFLLTGANNQVYERNPKYDTAAALAWRKQDTGTSGYPIIDWTPYYTNTLNDPQVGDTIYSDAACTTAVTTISSIA